MTARAISSGAVFPPPSVLLGRAGAGAESKDGVRNRAAGQFLASLEPSTPVIVAGGLVTPLGSNSQSTWEALLAGRFITDHARIDCDAENGEPRVVTLARQAAQDANFSHRHRVGDDRTALVVGTSKGPVEAWLQPPSHMSNATYVSRGVALDGLASIASTLGNELKINGPRLTVSAACASGLLALIRAALLVQNGDADRALVVAVEASVHPLFIASFRRLGVLPRPGVGCRPFDNQREGFLMSDAAAAVWLERADIATPGELPPVAIERFALAEDATHLTGADPSGRVLRSVIDRCIANEPLDLIHAHGTGTQLNDAIELAALDDAAARFESPPEIYSHKGALGHSLGAAGLVSVLLSCHSHLEGLIPPNIRTHDPMPTDRLRLELKALRRPVNQSLALAAGFGGTIAAVTLRSA